MNNHLLLHKELKIEDFPPQERIEQVIIEKTFRIGGQA
jgi:predicted Zn-dependent protease with MMP-like domain